MDGEVTKAKLPGFGSALLDNVDPNLVGAGNIQTKALQVGSLLWLEPNAQAQMYQLTLRTCKEPVFTLLCELLAPAVLSPGPAPGNVAGARKPLGLRVLWWIGKTLR